MRIKVKIEGTRPCMLNRFSEKSAVSATNGTSEVLKSNANLTPQQEAEQGIYYDSTGKQPIVPMPNMFACLREAGKYHKIGKKTVTTQKSSMLNAYVEIEELEIPIVSSTGWHPDTRPVRNPNTNGRFLKSRPMWNVWSLEFTLRVDNNFDIKLLR